MIFRNKIGRIPGEFAYKLYDTYGLRPDTIAELAEIESLSFDKNDFDRTFEEARRKSKAASGQASWDLISRTSLDFLEQNGVPKTDDSYKYRYRFEENGYEFLPVNAKLLGFVVNGKSCRVKKKIK